MSSPAAATGPGLYLTLDRRAWARLGRVGAGGDADSGLSAEALARLRGLAGLGDRLDDAEVLEVYLPLARLVRAYERAARTLREQLASALGVRPRAPFVLGIAGGVAVGKSTVARVLRALLAADAATPRVDLVTTDGFLLPNAELVRRGLLDRKGFPESYDRRALLRFLARARAGEPAAAPVYSHLTYDVVPGEQVAVEGPDVLIVEGVNVLQPPVARLPSATDPRSRQSGEPGPDGRARLAVADFFDASVYVDARLEDVRRWYVERFLELRRHAFADPASYFHRYAALDDAAAAETAQRIFREINEVNLVENILPTRGRATVVLSKGGDHRVERVLLRRP